MTINDAFDYIEDINKTVTFTEEQKIDEQFFNNIKDWLEELKFLSQWKSDVMDEFCKYDCNSVEEVLHNGYNKGINDCADKFADILSNMTNICGTNCPVKCNWGTEISCKDMCKKWLIEQLKEE